MKTETNQVKPFGIQLLQKAPKVKTGVNAGGVIVSMDIIITHHHHVQDFQGGT
jgi:hypothetical protein